MASQINWLRVGLMVAGVVLVIPATVLFGIFGFLGMLLFVLLAAIAK